MGIEFLWLIPSNFRHGVRAFNIENLITAQEHLALIMSAILDDFYLLYNFLLCEINDKQVHICSKFRQTLLSFERKFRGFSLALLILMVY